MGYVALKRIRWGDWFLEQGDPVPEDDPGRNYHMMVRTGLIGGLPSKPAKAPPKTTEPKAPAAKPKAPPKTPAAE